VGRWAGTLDGLGHKHVRSGKLVVQGWTSEERELVQAIKQVAGDALNVEPT